MSETHARWIVEGGTRVQWDAYLRALYQVGLPKLMEIYQEALDRF